MNKSIFEGVVFDLDGVITKTAKLHFEAWKSMFDSYLKTVEERGGTTFKEFKREEDYLPYVDGKPRYEGVKSFLNSRQIDLPFGEITDLPDKETICGLGNKKNVEFIQYLKAGKTEVYPTTIEFVKKFKAMGLKVGVASSSKNCADILNYARISELFETVVDGKVSASLGLKGKPEGDIFVKAAQNMNVEPSRSIVVEDATSGVAAGRNGGFRLVIGVARENNTDDLLKAGADIVVSDLEDLEGMDLEKFSLKQPSYLFDFWDKDPDKITTEKGELKSPSDKVFFNPLFFKSAKTFFSKKKKTVFFLDYDGTLTPIVDKPSMAVITPEMKSTLRALSEKFQVAIVSGRSREDVENLVGIKELLYVGNHGFDIKGQELELIMPEVQKFMPLIKKITEELYSKLGNIEGCIIEKKKFSAAVHYRLVSEEQFPLIKQEVDAILKQESSLRLMKGKKVFELLPYLDWDKGKALMWVMKALNISWDTHNVIYIGDDTTDENAFRILKTRGAGILVSQKPVASFADFFVTSTDEIKKLFEAIINA